MELVPAAGEARETGVNSFLFFGRGCICFLFFRFVFLCGRGAGGRECLVGGLSLMFLLWAGVEGLIFLFVGN